VRFLLGDVLVTGATGTTGRRVVAGLKREGVSCRAVSRTSEIAFDWARPDTWWPVLDGMRAVYLVPEGSPGAEVVGTFCRAAASAGVASIVLLSTREAEYPGYERYLEIEDVVSGSGTGWTILRCSWFDQNFHTHYDREVRSGVLRLPAGDGRDPFIDAEDVADVAVHVLTEHGHEEKVYELSGPEAISFARAAERITALTGLTVTYEAITPGAYYDQLIASGVAESDARLYVDNYRPIADGNNDYESEGVRRLIGRFPKDFDSFVKNAVMTGVWPARAG
jgi:uncharacterized protein YbjT (DUF2867 family)